MTTIMLMITPTIILMHTVMVTIMPTITGQVDIITPRHHSEPHSRSASD